MNERIRQLAEQARVQDRGYFIYQYGGPTGHQSVEKAIDLEKFAELIVAECISTLEEKIYRSIDHEGDEIWIDLLLKEHFGVEE
jgi:hypothetical protein